MRRTYCLVDSLRSPVHLLQVTDNANCRAILLVKTTLHGLLITNDSPDHVKLITHVLYVAEQASGLLDIDVLDTVKVLLLVAQSSL
jgi:hypothetical protein